LDTKMTSLNLTEDEREYLGLVARDQHGARSRLGFYASALLPMLAFGIYGFVRHDFVAEFIAFAGTLLFTSWRISQEFRRLDVCKSLFRKVAEHEKRSDSTYH